MRDFRIFGRKKSGGEWKVFVLPGTTGPTKKEYILTGTGSTFMDALLSIPGLDQDYVSKISSGIELSEKIRKEYE